VLGLLAGFAFRQHEFDHHLHRAVHHGIETSGKTRDFSVLLLLTTSGRGALGAGRWCWWRCITASWTGWASSS
jgi:hypothetical protein